MREPRPADPWTTFLEKNHAKAYETARFCLRVYRVERAVEPDDIVQEAFVRFLLATQARGEAPIDEQLPYFLQIIRNHVLDLARRSATQRRVDGDVAAWSENARTPWRQASALARLYELRAAVAGLASEQHRAIFLRRVEGLTLREIGEALGLPHTTVALRLTELPVALRAVLGDEEGAP